jgi:hypothetical protein
VRVANTGNRAQAYRLTFTPAGGASSGALQTGITVPAGATTALDDIVRNWFGFGSLNDGATGKLEIVPLDDVANTAKNTIVTSRTYNVTAKGTVGEFMPAIPFREFIGAGAPPLSMQQAAQNGRYRTNIGIAEGSAMDADLAVRAFDAAGTKILDVTERISGGQQMQLNGLLAQHGISTGDARFEVQVTGGAGKVTAYASVIDGVSGDPLLARGTTLTQTSVSRYILPGIANVDTGFAKWRSDVRLFNYGPISQTATLTFYPVGSAPRSAQITAKAGEVLALQNIVKNTFNAENLGGFVHIDTAQPSMLVVTARTYNDTPDGTFGQFIPAVTAAQTIGRDDGRTLQILQIEDSSRHRANVGIAEVTGAAVMVEVTVELADSDEKPVIEFPLAANEFRQFAPIRELGLGSIYNARISVRVVSGAGRVTAYGAVIDERTGDPTYIPAQ